MAMPKMGRCQGFTLGLTTDYKCGGQGLEGKVGQVGSVVGCWVGWQLGLVGGVGWLVCWEWTFGFSGLVSPLKTKHST